MKKPLAMVLALVGLLLVAAAALSGCASPEPVFDISVEKVEQPPPGPPLPGTPPSLPLTPEPHPTEVQQVFQPGDVMYVFIVVNPRLSKSVSFSKYTVFNRKSKAETDLPPNGSFGPYNPGTGFAVAYEDPWTVPAEPGNYEFRVYVGSKVVASARFDVVANSTSK